ncbi:MAG: hypothetical protein UY34_C0011G0013 [Parcubacteria group bacterium GW2011_GWA2_48_9]|nr:MAG: hypothetical protein UY34_C0011G0013 [Parcubacteria group bacterium GW2011_GWA2_48_9]
MYSCGVTIHQGVVRDVFCDYRARTNKRMPSNNGTANDRCVCPDGCTLLHKRGKIDPVLWVFGPRIHVVRENHRGSTKNVVLEGNTVIYRYVVLYFYVVSDSCFAADIHVLAKRTVLSDFGARHDMAKMPYLCTFANFTRFVDVT